MRFTLTYEGPLPPKQKGISPIKRALRESFHPQLKERMEQFYLTGIKQVHQRVVNGNAYFNVITEALSNAAELEILLLSPPALVRPGDNDNRLKTVLDGLTCPSPSVKEEPSSEQLWCLLEDDKLVTRYTLDSRPWLGRPAGSTDSLVIIGVNIISTASKNWSSTLAS